MKLTIIIKIIINNDRNGIIANLRDFCESDNK